MRLRDPISITLPFEGWPDDDRQAWAAAVMPSSLFGDGGTAANWALATRRSYEGSWGRYLRFLISTGWLDRDTLFAARARPEWVAAYVESLEARVAPISVWSYISDLHNVCYRLAPDHDWSWLRDIVNRLHRMVGPRHIAPDRLIPIDKIFRAGFGEMDLADAAGPLPRLRDSIRYRNGLMLALLAATLLRLGNFATLDVGGKMIRQSDGWLLSIPAAEVKNRQEIEQTVTGRLKPYLDRYVTHHHRRLLQGGESSYLWINQYGGVMKSHAVAARIAKTTSKLFGVSISTHLFRHCAATTIAIKDPEHAMIIRSVLSHARIETAERYYNRASIADAGRRHAATIADLRESLTTMDLEEEFDTCAP